MKKNLLKILCLILCVPVIFFCGCGNDKTSALPSINLKTYYNETADTSLFGESIKGKFSLEDMYADKPNTNTLARYTAIELKGNLSWLYKMYVDRVTFYVYTSSKTSGEMVVSLSMTNMASEDDLSHPSTYSDTASFVPTENGSFLCTYNVKKVVATAVDADNDLLTIDILQSVNNTIADSSSNATNFTWTVYGLKIYGESRSYSH